MHCTVISKSRTPNTLWLYDDFLLLWDYENAIFWTVPSKAKKCTISHFDRMLTSINAAWDITGFVYTTPNSFGLVLPWVLLTSVPLSVRLLVTPVKRVLNMILCSYSSIKMYFLVDLCSTVSLSKSWNIKDDWHTLSIYTHYAHSAQCKIPPFQWEFFCI